MTNTSFLKEYARTFLYTFLSSEKRTALGQKKLSSLIAYVKESNSYLSAPCKGIDTNHKIEISALPITERRELMNHFDEWVTDKAVNKQSVLSFKKNFSNIDKRINNQYALTCTSGSTGDPLIFLNDTANISAISSLSSIRIFSTGKEWLRFILRRKRYAGLYANVTFSLSNGIFQQTSGSIPISRGHSRLIDVLQPANVTVKELNDYRPTVLLTYASSLAAITEEQEAGRLHIKPVLICTVGEHLDNDVRRRAEKAFRCSVYSNYASTEAGIIANECRCKHLHINEDFVIVEAVDKELKPIPDGVLSDGVLITNLSNRIAPVIRYHMSDRVIIHGERCACGNKSKWIEIKGRSGDVLSFDRGGEPYKIGSLVLPACLYHLPSLRQFQLILHPSNNLEIRLVPNEGFRREEAFAEVKNTLEAILRKNGITTTSYILSSHVPSVDKKTNKFRQIYQTDEAYTS